MRVRLLLFAFLATLSLPATSETVKVWEDRITIPTYAWHPGSIDPVFPAVEGNNIYPYTLQDQLGDTKTDRTYRALFMENEYLRVCVLPELGGHVYEIINKSIDKPMYYVNHVIKPNLLAMRGAWISGGVEWNTGPMGHAATCVEPIESCLLNNADGSASIVVGHVERIFRTHWTVVLTLRPGTAALDERIRLFNAQDEVHPYYFWNNTAMPNTDGFQFIYPMTLGTDHAGTSFYTWPIDERGVDLSYAKNHPGPSAIFAYECDQDFFGSYDHLLHRGVVATADHYLLPGKKAWTWGQSEDSKLRQSLLTDDDGPYNEVQTGPLRTQADFGFLQPHQVLEWTERWYPVHDLEGFNYADREAAFHVTEETGELLIRFLTTSCTGKGSLTVSAVGNSALYAVDPTPKEPTVIHHPTNSSKGPWRITLIDRNGRERASFAHPLPLPVRRPPALPTPIPEEKKTAYDLWLDGQVLDKQSQPAQARKQYRKALEKDPAFGPALCSLAVLDLESGKYETACKYAAQAVERNPDWGMGWYWLSVGRLRSGFDDQAEESAWKAVRFPESAALGYSVLARLAVRSGRLGDAVSLSLEALQRNDRDLVSRDVLAAALFLLGEREDAAATAEIVLNDNPLDLAAHSIGYLSANSDRDRKRAVEKLRQVVRDEPQNVLEMAAFWINLRRYEPAAELLQDLYLEKRASGEGHPIAWYYAGWLAYKRGQSEQARNYWKSAQECSPTYVFPHRLETIPILRAVLDADPQDSRAALYLGNLLFAKGQLEEGRKYWERSVEISPPSSVAFRNLGLAANKIDGDRKKAIEYYEQALQCDPEDPILYRDLAELFEAEGKAREAIALLEKGYRLPYPRRDSTEMLARLYLKQGMYPEAIRFLETTVFQNWENQFTSHELFVKAHLEQGKKLLQGGDPKGALEHFDKSLTFPKNLAVERGPHIREANSHYWRGMALKALGRLDEAKKAFQAAVAEPESPDHKESSEKAAKELAEMK
ncbi:MAG TPA: DUF5107 domain-containing protein [bacterium]|nr:DUF5107 domain-containing protein [bacterium]HQL60942.1 DUF5107 domain-containing protein [bacterium]